MEQVAHMLGVEVGEEFKVKDVSGYISPKKFKFTNENFVFVGDFFNDLPAVLNNLLTGELDVVKIPFKPKYNEVYWYAAYTSAFAVNRHIWRNDSVDLTFWKAGNCFRTKEEAETKGKEIYEQIKREYEET